MALSLLSFRADLSDVFIISFRASKSIYSSAIFPQSSIFLLIFSISRAGTKPRCLSSTAISSFLGMPPITGTFANFSTDSLAFLKCLGPLTLFKITPSIRTSGSRALKPNTTAAALFTKLLESIRSTTGASNAFAIEAVLPISLIGLIPS